MKPIDQMSDEELRIAVARSLGWKSNSDKYYTGGLAWYTPEGKRFGSTGDLPQWTFCLNAMHSAEATLLAESQIGDKDSPFARYVKELQRACGRCKDSRDRNSVTVWEAFAYAIIATARQRCIAFLQTKATPEKPE